jgi:hypothetical protein
MPARKILRRRMKGKPVMYQQFALLFLLIATGFLCKYFKIIDDSMMKGLNRFIISVAYPCLILNRTALLIMQQGIFTNFFDLSNWAKNEALPAPRGEVSALVRFARIDGTPQGAGYSPSPNNNKIQMISKEAKGLLF